MPDDFTQPTNDNVSKALDDLVPAKYKGSDKYLDVITWNIRYFHDMDSQRVERITDILEQLNGDVLVFEEIMEGSLDIVADKLHQRGAGNYKVSYGQTGGDQRVAMMYDVDWIRAKDSIGEMFGKNKYVTESGKEVFPRLPLRGYFTAQNAGIKSFDFQLVGLHLKSQVGGGFEQRKLAAKYLKKWLVNKAPLVDSDVIMIGDWNEPPNSKTWSVFHQLEKNKQVAFSKINNSSEVSHLMYHNKNNLGSRLDLVNISMAAVPEIKDTPQVVRWKSLDDLLDKSPKAKEIKEFLKTLREKVSDHMPVVTRFYFYEKS